MKKSTSKFDKVLNSSRQFGKVNHEPDSSKEIQINTPEKNNALFGSDRKLSAQQRNSLQIL